MVVSLSWTGGMVVNQTYQTGLNMKLLKSSMEINSNAHQKLETTYNDLKST